MSKVPAKRFLIIGRANVGKTLFILNFAEYMGYDELTIKFRINSSETVKFSTISSFKKSMVSNNPNTTKCLQVADIDIPVYKGKKTVEFVDSTGISSSIHYNQDIREGMAQTLGVLRDCYTILHIIDAAWVSEENKIDDIDMEVYKYGKKRGNYLVLANKSDLEGYERGFELINNSLEDVRIISISALLKSGFHEVKKYVSRIA